VVAGVLQLRVGICWGRGTLAWAASLWAKCTGNKPQVSKVLTLDLE